MRLNILQNRLSRIVVILPALASLFVTTKINIDPVNLPKMVLISIVSGYLLGILISGKFFDLRRDKFLLFSALAILFALIVSTFLSDSPLVQVFYGSWARNTGLLTYLCLLIILIASAAVNQNKFFEISILSLAFAGLFNVFYGFLQVNGIDPVDWNNTFNAIIGTLGNPNFSSAFIAISLLTYPCIYFGIEGKFKRSLVVVLFLVSLYAIYLTKSQQGYIFLATGGAVIVNIYLMKKLRLKVVGNLVLAGTGVGFIASIAGILQKGPLADYLYQPSVSLRGFYWQAGLDMFKDSPIYGKGLDAYGDLYLRFREPASILPPGGQGVFSNAAHNVLIDMAASGGLLLLIPYVVILFYALVLAVRVLKLIEFDWVFVTLLSCWVAFQFELIISINQIGLAVWVWALTGLLIARSKWLLEGQKETHQKSAPAPNRKEPISPSAFLITAATTIVFSLAALPEQVADMNFKSSMQSKNVERVVKAIDSFPASSERMSRASQVLLRSSLNDYALSISQKAIEFNPNHLNSWITLAYNPSASKEDRLKAKQNLMRLDPLSDEWAKLEIK